MSAGWDKLVKVWSFHKVIELRTNLEGHTGYLNTVTVAPDGSLCASGGKDGTVMLWDLTEGKKLYSLPADDIIHSLVFSPNRYWLVGATQSCIRIWDLESKGNVDKLEPDFVPTGKNATIPYCTSWRGLVMELCFTPATPTTISVCTRSTPTYKPFIMRR